MSDFEAPQDPPELSRPDPFAGEQEFSLLDSDAPVVGAVQPEVASKGRPWMALGAAALVVLVIGGGAFAFRSFLSTSVAAAEVMPPDTEFFFSVDFLQLIEGDALKLNDTIISMIETSGEVDSRDILNVDGLVREIDAAMSEAIGVDFTDDIRPWVGRTVSFSMSGFESLTSNDLPELLLAVETRDGGASDLFLEDFANGLEQATGVDVARATRNGTVVFTASDEFDFDPALVFTRVGSMVVFGTQSAVEGALTAEGGASLADNASFASVMDSLPSDRLMSIYLNGAVFSDALESEALVTDAFAGIGYDAVGASVSIADYGVRVETVVLGSEPMGGVTLEMGDVTGDLPFDTLAMFGGWSVASYWEAITTALGGTDAEDLLADAEQEIGVDVGSFLNLLDAPSALALVKTTDGAMAQEIGYPIGLMALLGTTNPDEVEKQLEDLVGYARDNGLEDIARATFDSGTYWMVGPIGSEMAVVGVTERYLAAASSGSLATSIGSSPSLSDNARLVAVAEAMGVDPGSVVFFVDTQSLVELFEPPPEIAAALGPLGQMAAAYEMDVERAHGVFVWMIDYVDD